MKKEQILKDCTVEGNTVKLPNIQLDRKDYQEVAKALQLIGGKWKGGKVMGFVFNNDPTDLLKQLQNGEKRNIKKEFQFFATPKKIADLMCEKAFDPYENKKLKILEPSAGQGSIIDSVLDWFKNKSVITEIKSLTAVEFMKENLQFITKKYSEIDFINIQEMDFLKYDEYINYFDVVIANPPFSKHQDINHFMKMYEVCAPGGMIVSIMSNGFLYNTQKKASEFISFLGLKNDAQTRFAAKGGSNFVRTNEEGTDEELYIQTFEAGEFKESGTNVHTVLLCMRKNCISGVGTKKNETTQQISLFN